MKKMLFAPIIAGLMALNGYTNYRPDLEQLANESPSSTSSALSQKSDSLPRQPSEDQLLIEDLERLMSKLDSTKPYFEILKKRGIPIRFKDLGQNLLGMYEDGSIFLDKKRIDDLKVSFTQEEINWFLLPLIVHELEHSKSQVLIDEFGKVTGFFVEEEMLGAWAETKTYYEILNKHRDLNEARDITKPIKSVPREEFNRLRDLAFLIFSPDKFDVNIRHRYLVNKYLKSVDEDLLELDRLVLPKDIVNLFESKKDIKKIRDHYAHRFEKANAEIEEWAKQIKIDKDDKVIDILVGSLMGNIGAYNHSKKKSYEQILDLATSFDIIEHMSQVLGLTSYPFYTSFKEAHYYRFSMSLLDLVQMPESVEKESKIAIIHARRYASLVGKAEDFEKELAKRGLKRKSN